VSRWFSWPTSSRRPVWASNSDHEEFARHFAPSLLALGPEDLELTFLARDALLIRPEDAEAACERLAYPGPRPGRRDGARRSRQ